MQQDLQNLEQRLLDQGRMIEAGWIGLRIAAIPADAPPLQVEEMRNAFFAGAQHLLICIMRVVDPGRRWGEGAPPAEAVDAGHPYGVEHPVEGGR